MKKIKILIPIYNDWESLQKLLNDISEQIKNYNNFKFSILVVNDGSTEKPINRITLPKNIKEIKILNIKLNQGHPRSFATGIKYILQQDDFDYLISMDGDGEDRPEEIKLFIDKIEKKNDISIVAKRVKRSEGILFKILYELHKILTLLFTGKNMNFGNFSCLTKMDVKKISESAALWNNFPSTVKQKLKSLDHINCIRGTRYFGPSKMSLMKLIILSFSIISVFRLRVFLISSIYIILMFFLNKFLMISLFKPFLVTIILFNLVILILSLRANKKELDNCLTNIQTIIKILH